MRRPVPDPDALVAALARRVDALERDTKVLYADADSFGRGIAKVTGQIERLAGDRTTSTPAAAGSGGGAPAAPPAGGGDDGSQDEGQRDWLTVIDPDVAVAWVTEAGEWAREILTRHGLPFAQVPCWPVHPDVVGDLLGLIAQREEAYTGAKPAAVSEWLTRWLPAGIDRIRSRLAVCLAERGHSHDGRLYDAGPLDPAHAADWWATNRHTPAPRALGLRSID